MWNIAGGIGAILVGSLAWWRSRAPGSFYDREIYAMTSRTHGAYAAGSLVFFVLFAMAAAFRVGTIGVWLFGAFVLFALFYVTSFLRGAHEDDG